MGVSRNVKEFDDGRMSGKEKNPKQILIDWVRNVNSAATCGKNALHNNTLNIYALLYLFLLLFDFLLFYYN